VCEVYMVSVEYAVFGSMYVVFGNLVAVWLVNFSIGIANLGRLPRFSLREIVTSYRVMIATLIARETSS